MKSEAERSVSRTKQVRRRLRDRALDGLLRLISRLLGRVSWQRAQAIGRSLGRLAWAVGGRDRDRTLTHLGLAFPDLDAEEVLGLARAAFRHHGTSLAECLRALRMELPEVLAQLRIEGWEHVERAREAGRPVLVLTGHCGNWELLGPAFQSRDTGLSVVARGIDAEKLNRLLQGLRERFGTETIERGRPGAARRLLAVLRSDRALALLIDQDTRVEGAWVPFFGQTAFTPIGAARIALKRGAAVLPTFAERLENGTHVVRIHPAMELPGDVTEATAAMTLEIENQVRRRPEQWVWMHRRWRRRPPED